MIRPKMFPLVIRQVMRQRTRGLLTIAGVTVAMLLYTSIAALQSGVESVTRATAGESTLIVYRKDRFCPSTSRMSQNYADRLAAVPGVASVLPMQIVVNNCRASLDVVTFRGVPESDFSREIAEKLRLKEGSLDEWAAHSDAALLGETLARRRGLRPGDRFSAAGVTVLVAGVFASDEPQHENVAYVHLDFLQRSAGRGNIGFVTQFVVRVKQPEMLKQVAAAIDAEFARDPDPTHTRGERAFVASAAADVLEIVRFTRWLGWGCLFAVLALVGNAIILAVQDRIREHAVLQTLGFRGGLIARLILVESTLLALAGGLLGSLLALVLLRWGRFTLSIEGTNLPIAPHMGVFGYGLLISVAMGALAGLIPAWQAGRRQIVECFRAV